MRAPRSLLLILGGTALVVGAVLAFATYSAPLGDLMSPALDSKLMSRQMRARFAAIDVPCERPVTAAFDRGGTDGGWFNYAPPDSVTFSPGNGGSTDGRVPCRT